MPRSSSTARSSSPTAERAALPAWHVEATENLIGRLNEFEERHAPPVLYFSGDRALFRTRPKVSIIGSRAATPDGLRRATKLTRILVGHHVVIVSGLAAGIDTAAHVETMTAGGRTIAVIGTSIDKVYPRANAELQARIARHHLVVSQFKPGVPTRPFHFPQRNRTMALLVDASVIVEAGDSSGSLSQGWEALRLNRPLFIMRSVLDRPDITWPRKMLDYGATVLDDRAQVLLESLPCGELADVPF